MRCGSTASRLPPPASRFQIDPLLLYPPLIRPDRRKLGLYRFVVENPSLRSVDDQHLSRLDSSLRANVLDCKRQRARLGSEHDEIIGSDDVSRRPQAVAIEN